MVVDKNPCEIYCGHKWFDSCEKFFNRWNQMSFDLYYNTHLLAHFEQLVHEISSRPLFDSSIVVDEA